MTNCFFAGVKQMKMILLKLKQSGKGYGDKLIMQEKGNCFCVHQSLYALTLCAMLGLEEEEEENGFQPIYYKAYLLQSLHCSFITLFYHGWSNETFYVVRIVLGLVFHHSLELFFSPPISFYLFLQPPQLPLHNPFPAPSQHSLLFFS